MAKSELTLHIEQLLFERLGRSEVGCKEVTIGWYDNEIVDFITVTANKAREIKCFEIKVSKADYHSKAHLTFIGHKNYFVMPNELYAELREDIIANYPYVGVYAYDRKYDHLVLAKKATLRELKADKEVIYTSILRSMQREWFKAVSINKNVEHIDKAKPKELYYEGDDCDENGVIYDTAICPNCDKRFEIEYDEHANYCPNCGQALKWRNEDE